MRGNPTALALFERRYFDEVPIAYARFRTTTTLDELRQALRARLFVVDEAVSHIILLIFRRQCDVAPPVCLPEQGDHT